MSMQIILNILLSSALIFITSIAFFIKYISVKYFEFTLLSIISISAYVCFLLSSIGLASVLFIPIAVFSGVIFGLLLDLVVYKTMRLNFSPKFAILIASIGLYVIIQNLVSIFFGDDSQNLNTGEIVVGHQFFGAYVSTVRIITIVVAGLVFLGMYLIYNYTLLGKQIRAISENSDLAGIYGISYNKIILVTTAISSALAAIAGILYAYDTNLTPTMGFNLLLYGIVSMIIGGIGSFRGLLLSSLLLATAQNLVAYYLDTKWMDAVTYAILIAFLLWKPLGFSGKILKKVEI